MWLAKTKKKVIKPVTDRKADKIGQRIYVDLSSTLACSLGGSKYWMLVVDQLSKYKWSVFLKKKSELAKALVEIIKEIKYSGKRVEFKRCDNSGYNTVIKRELIENNLTEIKLEFTATYTPQFNVF